MRKVQKMIQRLKFGEDAELNKVLSSSDEIRRLMDWAKEHSLELEYWLLERYHEILRQNRAGQQVLSNAFYRFHRHIEHYQLQYFYATQNTHKIDVWHSVIHSVLGKGDYWWAVRLCDEALVYFPKERQNRQYLIEALAVLAHHQVGDALQRLQPEMQAFVEDFPDIEALLMVLKHWMVWDIVEAETILRRALVHFPKNPHLLEWDIQLLLWKGKFTEAHSTLDSMDLRDISFFRWKVLGTLAMMDKDYVQAKECFERALQYSSAVQNSQAEIWRWLAEWAYFTGNYQLGIEYADKAAFTSPRFNILNKVLRELNICAHYHPTKNNSMHLLEIGSWIETLVSLDTSIFEGLEQVLKQFKANRSDCLCLSSEGGLSNFQQAPDPAHIGREIQHVLYTRGIQEAIALSEKYKPHFPSAFFNNYQGELFLWVGEYERAERCFREGIANRINTKWCWIGLGASLMYQGKEREALQTWEQGLEIVQFAGPTLYAYRGECQARLGNFASAKADLQYSIAQKPTRMSSQLLLDWIRIQEDASKAPAIMQKLWKDYPIMMWDIIGVQRLTPKGIIERVLSAMKGNRSSTMVMYMIDEKLRFLPLDDIQKSIA